MEGLGTSGGLNGVASSPSRLRSITGSRNAPSCLEALVLR
jgi:hypothetical protein